MTKKENEKRIQEEYTSFVNVVTHDFKNIFRSLKYITEWIEEAIDKEDWEEVKNLRRMMVEKTSFGDRAIEVLAQWSKIQNIDCSTHPLNLKETITEVINEFDSEANKFTISGSDEILNTNYEILKLILIELIDNSISFNKKELKKINIDIQSTENCVELRITDNGIKIRESQLSDIFKVMYSSKKIQTTRHTGMGLPRVLKYLQLINGNIFLESSTEDGSTFKIEIIK